MSDHVIDTNVLLVASAAHPYSPFDNSNVPLDLQIEVLDWLIEFRADRSRQMVWDDWFRIYDEYRNKLKDEDLGLQVVLEKMETARFVPISFDNDDIASIPPEFGTFDPSDRKFLATMIADPGDCSLINATDTDWLEIEKQLDKAGLTVVHLIESWLRSKFEEKRS